MLGTIDAFGPYRRQLFAIDIAGVPETTVHEQLDLLGTEVLPTLHRIDTAPPATEDRPASREDEQTQTGARSSG